MPRPRVHASVIGTVAPGRNDHYIFTCIKTLIETTRGAPFDLSITAVDNSPEHPLGAELRDAFPGVTVIENPVRKGFAANHNMALRPFDADYLLVLNDDLVIKPGAVQRAVEYMEAAQHRRVGVASFQLVRPDGSIQPSTYSFPTIPRALLDYSGLRSWIPFGRLPALLARIAGKGEGRSRFWDHDRTVAVDTVGGAAMLVRGAAAREVGPMDEASLLGGEETEWHKRFWNAGWSVVFLHDAPVVHFGSQTIAVSPTLRVEAVKGLLNYFRKHRSRLAFTTLAGSLAAILGVRALGYALVARRDMAAAMWRGASLAARAVSGRPVS